MHYTHIGKEKSMQIWRIDLKYCPWCVPCVSEYVLFMWTDGYDVRRAVAYFQESYIELSKYLINLSACKT